MTSVSNSGIPATPVPGRSKGINHRLTQMKGRLLPPFFIDEGAILGYSLIMEAKRTKTIYLDSTIPSYYYEGREDPIIYARHLITVQWWNTRRKDYDTFVSDFVLREISDGDYPHRDKVVNLVKESRIQVLEANLELAEIVEVFMGHFLMPRNSVEDAWHLAFASYYKIDFLLTWNCKHLANANKQEHIFRVLSGLKLFIPIITTPENLLEE